MLRHLKIFIQQQPQTFELLEKAISEVRKHYSSLN
ncbi:hypothetical protein LEP3755_66690 (plasmid) [Leptolyngbya sp. NIES-3755]|nr:hypothetical protein LEP3755_66690 [Leptolyngbya sp. NIES-3755]